MPSINPELLKMAEHRIWKEQREKIAVVPPDPSMMGGAPPGGAPAGSPPVGAPAPGGAPPMGAPPMGGDPSMMGGAPPPGGAPPMGAPPPAMAGGAMDPSMQMGMMGQQPQPQKLKPEQMMQMLDFRLYNMQQQMTALMNNLNVQLPPGALVTPPGSPTPVAEAAVPGGPQDPGPAAGAGGAGGAGGGGGDSAIQPIGPVQGASPELAAGGAGGGGEKMGQAMDRYQSFSDFVEKLASSDVPVPTIGSSPRLSGVGTQVSESASAIAAMLRRRTAGVV